MSDQRYATGGNADHRRVETVSTWIPVSYRDVLDFGLGDGKLQQWAREQQAEDDAELERYWRSLPWRVRAWRRFSAWRGRVTEVVMGWLHHRLFPDCEDRW